MTAGWWVALFLYVLATLMFAGLRMKDAGKTLAPALLFAMTWPAFGVVSLYDAIIGHRS